jgi:hypothetical protein
MFPEIAMFETNAKGTTAMASTVAHMTKRELTEIISSTVERKLLEILGDPDEGLTLKKSLRRRLLRQKKAVARGERGTDLASTRKQLSL